MRDNYGGERLIKSILLAISIVILVGSFKFVAFDAPPFANTFAGVLTMAFLSYVISFFLWLFSKWQKYKREKWEV